VSLAGVMLMAGLLDLTGGWQKLSEWYQRSIAAAVFGIGRPTNPYIIIKSTPRYSIMVAVMNAGDCTEHL